MEDIKANLERMGFRFICEHFGMSFFKMKDLFLSLRFVNEDDLFVYFTWNGNNIGYGEVCALLYSNLDLLKSGMRSTLSNYFVCELGKPVRFKYYEALINANLAKNILVV